MVKEEAPATYPGRRECCEIGRQPIAEGPVAEAVGGP